MNLIDTLFIDKGLFDDLYYGEGWMWDEGSEKYSAPISAITLNNNCIDFEYSPNDLGLPAKINLFPDTEYISIINNSITVDDTINYKKLKIERDWVGQTNDYLITGEILQWSEKDTIKKNIAEPSLFVGTVFKELLESQGTTINELYAADDIHSNDTVLVHYSRPLYKQIEDMMHNSKNLTSESLIKYIGITDSTKGTWENGIHKIKTYLFDEVNIDTSALRIADGSGLSRYNLLTTDQIVKLLVHMHSENNDNIFVETLPHGNERDSRLEGRLLEAQDKIYAKTGSISGVSCLSGYAFSSTQGPLAFSIMINGFVGSIKPYRDFQDEVCNWLVKN
jgi:D-alanyl-D-alanine carboxypeptidase/D-alanyl-D-alanine-endopeptidase (penicillin-binding protein 4)